MESEDSREKWMEKTGQERAKSQYIPIHTVQISVQREVHVCTKAILQAAWVLDDDFIHLQDVAHSFQLMEIGRFAI